MNISRVWGLPSPLLFFLPLPKLRPRAPVLFLKKKNTYKNTRNGRLSLPHDSLNIIDLTPAHVTEACKCGFVSGL